MQENKFKRIMWCKICVWILLLPVDKVCIQCNVQSFIPTYYTPNLLIGKQLGSYSVIYTMYYPFILWNFRNMSNSSLLITVYLVEKTSGLPLVPTWEETLNILEAMRNVENYSASEPYALESLDLLSTYRHGFSFWIWI